MQKPISYKFRVFLGFISVFLITTAYLNLSYIEHQKNPHNTTLPDLSQFRDGFIKLIQVRPDGKIWIIEDLIATFSRHISGIAFGVLISFIVGIGMGVSSCVEALLSPPVSFMAKLPPTAMLAIYFVLFGTDFEMYIAMIGLGIFPTLAQTIHQSVKSDVPTQLIYKAYTLGASHFEVIFNIICMQILPRIIEAVRLTIGPTMIMLIAAEWAVGSMGFGYQLRIQSRLLNMNVVYIYLIVLGSIGFFMDWTLVKLRRFLCPWYGA